MDLSAQNIAVKDVDDVYLNTPDSSLHFQVSRIKYKESKLDLSKKYFWYKTGTLSCNKGSYAGLLLDGKYRVFDSNKRLREEGYFKNGLKVGVWKRWFTNGEYESIIIWKKGLKCGKAIFYNYNGNIVRSIDYKNDIISGYVCVYLSGKVDKIKYKNGVAAKINEKRTTSKVISKMFFKKHFSKDTSHIVNRKIAYNTKDSTLKKRKWYDFFWTKNVRNDDNAKNK